MINRTPIIIVPRFMHEEKFAKREPNISHPNFFGCIAYVLIPYEKRTKLDLRAKK